jgi:hypothetical protein
LTRGALLRPSIVLTNPPFPFPFQLSLEFEAAKALLGPGAKKKKPAEYAAVCRAFAPRYGGAARTALLFSAEFVEAKAADKANGNGDAVKALLARML